MRLIDADAIKYHRYSEWCGHSNYDEYNYITDTEIAKMPTIDPEDCRPHGRWKIKLDDYDCEYAMCSVCGEEFYDASGEDTIDITFNYCPHCGAKMNEKENYDGAD